MTGTTLFTVSRCLAEWERQGLVEAGRERVPVGPRQRVIDLDGVEFRIHDPVFEHTEVLVALSLGHFVGPPRAWRQDFHQQIGRAAQVLLEIGRAHV